MLLTNKVSLRINNNNYKYLETLGYKNLKMNEYLTIPTNHLSEGSGHKVKVKCDICGKEKMLQYRRYLLSYNNGGYYACSNSCNIDKRKYEITDEIKEKKKNTNLKKYGVESPFQSEKIKEKIKQTNIKNYGVENPFQSEEIKEKIRQTNIEKYGFENPSQSEEIKKKKEKTCLKNHGVKSPYQNIKIFNKSLKSALKIKKYRDSELHYQGSYEKNFLDEYYNKIKIIDGLTIKYLHNNKEKYYHSDFYLPKYDLIVEIKSTYWYKINEDINILKEKYSKISHNHLMILDKNYDDLDKLLKINN